MKIQSKDDSIGFPKRIATLLIDRFTTNAQNRAPDHITNDTSHNNQHSTIWLTILFVGDLTTQLVKKLKRKLRRCLVDPNVDIRITCMLPRIIRHLKSWYGGITHLHMNSSENCKSRSGRTGS